MDGLNVVQGITAVLQRRLPAFELEYPCPSPGQRRWFSLSVRPLQARGGGAVVACTDVTQRIGAELALRESEDRLRLALEIGHAGAWSLHLVDRTVRRTLEHDRIFGYEQLQPEWTYPMFLDHVLPEDRAAVDAKFGEAIATGSDWNFDCRIRRTDGEVRWIWVIGRHRYDDSGIPRRMTGVIQDITERKQAEESARAGLSKLEAALSSMSDALVISDTAGNFIHFNDAFVSFLRFRTKDECSRTLAEYPVFLDLYSTTGTLLPPERWPIFRALGGETATDVEFTLRRRDTGDTWVGSHNFAPIRDSNGAIVGSVITARDVTQRYAAEAARRDLEEKLRASENKYSILFNKAAIPAVLSRAPDHVCMEVNDAFAQLLGYAKEDLIGKPWTEWGIDRDAAGRSGLTQAIRNRGGAVRNSEHTLYSKRGNPITVLASIDTLNIGGQEYALTSLHDISDRKRVELALKEKEAQYRQVIETAADGVWVVDGQARLLVVNDAYARRSGYSREELLTMSVADVEADESPEDVSAHIERVRNRGSDLFETRHRAKDGEIWPVEVNVSYSAAAGGLQTVFLRDISERKRSEASARTLGAQMEQVMHFHVARQTVSAVAHELNQPLNAIVSYSDAALRLLRTGNPKPDRLQHALERAAEQAQRAGKVVRDLLSLLNKAEVKTETFDLNGLIVRALAVVKAAGLAKFRTALEINPELAPVIANRLQIEKVLVNLVQNGVEAMRDGGVSPKAAEITVRTAVDGRMAHVTVSDTGPGLDGSRVHKVFDPFYTTKASGLGMGLTVSRAIVEAHGGRLWVESKPDQGARFHFTLPFAP